VKPEFSLTFLHEPAIRTYSTAKWNQFTYSYGIPFKYHFNNILSFTSFKLSHSGLRQKRILNKHGNSPENFQDVCPEQACLYKSEDMLLPLPLRVIRNFERVSDARHLHLSSCWPKLTLFWRVTPYTVVTLLYMFFLSLKDRKISQTWRLEDSAKVSTLKMEVLSSFETLRSCCQAT
jgi:hypothetical protein